MMIVFKRGRQKMPRRISNETIEKILFLNTEGKTNLQISEELEIKSDTINKYLKMYGRKSNKLSQRSIHNQVDGNKAFCSECKEERLLTDFQYGRKGKPNEYRFSYCNKCRGNKVKTRLQEDLISWITNRIGILRRRTEGLPFDLDLKYVLELLEAQNNKCFYSDYELVFGRRKGLCPNSMSFDKIIPKLGYTKGNVVLCSARINSMKSNATLDEMKKWMPNWYERLKKAEFVKVI